MRARMEEEVRVRVEAQVAQVRERMEEQVEARQCALCMDKDKDCTFACGHQTCMQCALQLSVCHICQQRVTVRTRTYN